MDTCPFRTTVSQTLDGKHLVSVHGELDLITAPALEQILWTLDDNRDVVADFSAVTFMDSSGVAVLFRAYKSMNARGRSFSARGVTAIPRRVMEITGLDQVLDVAS